MVNEIQLMALPLAEFFSPLPYQKNCYSHTKIFNFLIYSKSETIYKTGS